MILGMGTSMILEMSVPVIVGDTLERKVWFLPRAFLSGAFLPGKFYQEWEPFTGELGCYRYNNTSNGFPCMHSLSNNKNKLRIFWAWKLAQKEHWPSDRFFWFLYKKECNRGGTVGRRIIRDSRFVRIMMESLVSTWWFPGNAQFRPRELLIHLSQWSYPTHLPSLLTYPLVSYVMFTWVVCAMFAIEVCKNVLTFFK